MDIENLRVLDLAAVCSLLNLERDEKDPKQFKTDGFRISVTGLKWFDHSAGKGGGGAIDLVMHVKHLSFMAAANYLSSAGGELPTASTKAATAKTTAAATKPPTPNKNNLPRILAYLTEQRGLNAALVQWCVDKGLIYADCRNNCVFRYGHQGAELRGTGAVQWRSVYGTIEHGFILPARLPVGVAVLESAIDALSYRQIHRDMITLSIAGNGNHKIIQQAVNIAKANKLPVFSAFDSDSGGNVADKILCGYAASDGVTVMQDRPRRKDWNEQLRIMPKDII
ncbi:MAG: DUF3991 and TOPRIM domain-containing protein [Methylobacter sp.]|nr:DUF3991 and TOPRIM domain-containing protein [Methylobacter sp.]MDP2099126.1 DUF3991 and TOPRIM domain-containing protein [Methylobacter sp.]MDP2429952.1 DUF3991 and TOPRIM domain-containing protein [Methylobacter sp.]MDP3054797.1 DUF3991 and TOPRIM domain-containing protein [Methylobacter sp.]MDP3361219.1 DUF3991 and TOPRIM domain-containing protein [Methylobacter sp.]